MSHFSRNSSQPSILWASRPLLVREGRLVAVKRSTTTDRVDVLLITQDGTGEQRSRWVAAEEVLSERQAANWVQSSTWH